MTGMSPNETMDPCIAIHQLLGVAPSMFAPDFSPNYTQDGSTNHSGNTSMDYSDEADFAPHFEQNHNEAMEDAKFYLLAVVNPVLCVCGLIGNIMNVVVLTRRRMQHAMDCPMEKAAQLGLIALAVSDMLYCITAIPDAFISRTQSVFHGRTFWLYVQVYGTYLQNVFMYTSTWLTVLMATGRYAAICRPLHARYLVEVKGTRIAVIMIFLIWVLLELPMLWEYSILPLVCPPDPTPYYLLDRGIYVQNNILKTAFMYIWSILGYFIPVVMLIYCNAHLISALKASYKMRKLYRVHSKAADQGAYITPTLITIVCAFLLLVSPSEIIHFYYYNINHKQVEAFNMAMVVSNVLQTLNFSLNFLLYCVVNVHFRDTWKSMMYCIVRKDYRSVRGGQTHTGGFSSATTTTTCMVGNGGNKSIMPSSDHDNIQLKAQIHTSGV